MSLHVNDQFTTVCSCWFYDHHTSDLYLMRWRENIFRELIISTMRFFNLTHESVFSKNILFSDLKEYIPLFTTH